MSVPVFAIPIISRPDLVGPCVGSIDAEVDRLVIIDNSPAGGMTELARAAAGPNVREILEVRPPENLGYGASLNFTIRTHPTAAWWMFANVDIVCAPGDIGRIVAEMESRAGLPFLCGIRDHRLFGVSAELIERVGFWDENFHPAYCEDTDHTRRIVLDHEQLDGSSYLMIDGQTGHEGSVVIHDPSAPYGALNARTYPLNRAYYWEKWGGDIGRETFTTPFNRGGHLGDWRLSLRRIREQRW